MAKTATLVDKDLLTASIVEAEAGQIFATQSAMFEHVTNVYNNKADVKITSSVVRSRITEWGIPFKTAAGKKGLGRAAVEVDKDRLIKSLNAVEKDGPLANRSILYVKVSEAYNDGADAPITPSVVNLRIESWGLTPLTAKARNKAPKANGESSTDQPEDINDNKVRYGKVVTYGQNSTGMRELLTENKEKKYIKLVKSIENGSKSAAIKLNCLQCTGFEKKEIKYCTCTWCPMFRFRPYHKKGKKIELQQV